MRIQSPEMSDTSSTSSQTGASLQVSVIFNGRVQADIESSLARESSGDRGGVLVGTADPALGLVVILAAEPLPPGGPGSGSLEFTPAVWSHMVDVVIQRHPGQRIVGWYHGHIGSGVFLSGHDLLIHTTYFGQPWQVAYVVDPTTDERGIFAWRGQRVVRVEHWDVTSGAKGVATSVAPNEPEGRAAVLRHLAQPVNQRPPSTPPVPTIAPSLPPAEVSEHLETDPPVVESLDASAWGYPLGDHADAGPEINPEDDTDPVDRPTAASDVEDDLDAWIASLPTTAEAGAATFAQLDKAPPAPRDSTHQEVEVLASAVIETKPRSRRKFVIAVIAALIVAAIVVGVVLTSGSDDKKAAPTTTAAPATVSSVTIPASTSTADVTTTAAPTTTETTEETVATDPPTSSTSAPTTSPTTVAPTTSTTPTLPPTPDAVASPSERVGSGSNACELGSDGLYVPAANCFVALPNGNIVAAFNSALVCVDPPGGALLAQAAPFLVGFGGDPLAVIAGGVALPRCEDLSYARNVMAGGATTFAGLCGNQNTSINQNSTRCFAQNPATGAIAALVAAFGSQNGLVGLCFAASGQSLPLPLTWTTPGVDATWTIESVAFEPGIEQFVLTANRDGDLATALMTCA